MRALPTNPSRRRVLGAFAAIALGACLAPSALAGRSPWEQIDGGTDTVDFTKNTQSDAGVAIRLHNRTDRRLRFNVTISVKDENGKRQRVVCPGVMTGFGYWTRDFEGVDAYIVGFSTHD